MREAWLDAPDVGAQQRIAAELQEICTREVAFLSTGQYVYRTAYRRDLRDVPTGLFTSWNVRRT